jgi:phosphatidylglycerophosphate synthase/putative flippase GtrA
MPESLLPLAVVGTYLLAALVALVVRNAVDGRFHDEETAARGDSPILPMSARMFFAWALQPAWRLVRWSGVPATAITTLSMLFAFGSGLCIATGHLAAGGWLYLTAGICDVLDGRIARASNTASRRGAAIDSVLDRYSDAAVLIGIAWLYHATWPGLVAVLALVGSLLVSYVRARGEGLGADVKVGLMQRPERVVLLGTSLALAPAIGELTGEIISADTVVIATVVFIAVMSHITALHRLLHTLRVLDARAPRSRWRKLLPATVSALVATGADFGLVSVLVGAFELDPAAATAGGCLLGGLINFSMNRWWTFRSKDAPALQAVRYTIVSVTSALLNSGGVALVLLLPLPDYRLAWLLVRGLVFLCWNYPLQRDYVYGAQGAGKPDAEGEVADDKHVTGTRPATG